MKESAYTSKMAYFSGLDLLITTLDMLAVALASHGHQWTARERRAYENAILFLRDAIQHEARGDIA